MKKQIIKPVLNYEFQIGDRASFETGGMELAGSIVGFRMYGGFHPLRVLLDVAGFGRLIVSADRLTLI